LKNLQIKMENSQLVPPQVLKDAAEILQIESNELARHLDAGDFKGLNYRVEIAVRTETQRLRGTTFKKFFQKTY